MTITMIAAIIYSIVSAGVIIFQIALALGAPWGAFAMGGKFPGKFPPAMRVTAVVQAMLLGLLAIVILSRARVLLPAWSAAAIWPSWGVVAFNVVSVVLNAMTRSSGERRIWLPVTLIMLACSLTVVLTAG